MVSVSVGLQSESHGIHHLQSSTNHQFLVQRSNLITFRIASRKIRQYPKFFLSDDYNSAVLPNQLCPVPLITPVPSTLSGSWLHPIFHRALVSYWRYILSDLLFLTERPSSISFKSRPIYRAYLSTIRRPQSKVSSLQRFEPCNSLKCHVIRCNNEQAAAYSTALRPLYPTQNI